MALLRSSSAPRFIQWYQFNSLSCRAYVTQEIAENTIVRASVERLPSWLTAFEPRRFLSNAHLQTIVGNFLPRPTFLVPAQAELVEVDPADGSRVLCHCHWQPQPATCLTVVLVHGLEGSSDSQYIQGVAARAWAAGFNVVRMNMRNCGDTDELTPTLYHSALSGDVGAVVTHFARNYSLQRIALVGYSMGGNLVLKLAGQPSPARCSCHSVRGPRSGSRFSRSSPAIQPSLRKAFSPRTHAPLSPQGGLVPRALSNHQHRPRALTPRIR